ncbi:hypothetical protein P3T23_001456 [Paraburkholderia sp. GAS448]|uniref:Arm DNA-binding domain-containing protein n=1 Tax=Paraburkholderia sp. GAS448 TaxID=3035136 RepID=UPI003D206C19
MGEPAAKTAAPDFSEVVLTALQPADKGRIIRDGSGLAGKAHAGKDGSVSVHFRYRYRYDGAAREVALGAWPRETLDAIRETFAEIRLRVSRGSDPAGQQQTVAAKVKLEQAQVRRQLGEEPTRQQHERARPAA